MTHFFLVFLGGGLGSLCRFSIGLLLNRYDLNFPLGTLIANAISCFLLGMLLSWSLKGELATPYRLMWATGFCGGFSTFSTFSAESLQLFQQGNAALALLNIAGSLLIGLFFVFLGMRVIGI